MLPRFRAASTVEDALRAIAAAEATGHPVDDPCYVSARDALGTTVLASGRLFVTKLSLGLVDGDPRDDEPRFFALAAAVFDDAGAYLGPALNCVETFDAGGEFLLDGATLSTYDPGREKGASMSLQLANLAMKCVKESVHSLRTQREMISRPKMSRNE